MKVAFYRVLYGQDFIQQSIKRIRDEFDWIFVLYTDKPWGSNSYVNYKGEDITFPRKFDNVIEKVLEMNDPKIRNMYYHSYTPANQHVDIMHKILEYVGTPELFMAIEPDMIFPLNAPVIPQKMVGDFMTTSQIELWKTLDYRIPTRPRGGPKYYKKIPSHTGFDGSCKGMVKDDSMEVYNLGFCASYNTMYWKHLTALSFSREIGDSIPYENWLDEVWDAWTPEMRNLEIAERHRSAISHAFPYNMPQEDKDFINGKK